MKDDDIVGAGIITTLCVAIVLAIFVTIMYMAGLLNQ